MHNYPVSGAEMGSPARFPMSMMTSLYGKITRVAGSNKGCELKMYHVLPGLGDYQSTLALRFSLTSDQRIQKMGWNESHIFR